MMSFSHYYRSRKDHPPQASLLLPVQGRLAQTHALHCAHPPAVPGGACYQRLGTRETQCLTQVKLA